MTRHVKEFHDEESSPSDVGPKQYVCPEVGCGKVFKFASKLQKHEESHGKFFYLSISFRLCNKNFYLTYFLSGECK